MNRKIDVLLELLEGQESFAAAASLKKSLFDGTNDLPLKNLHEYLSFEEKLIDKIFLNEVVSL